MSVYDDLMALRAENRRLRRRVRALEASRALWRTRARGEAWAARVRRRRHHSTAPSTPVNKPWDVHT